MQTSARGTCSGFTLIELLVVLAIMGVAAAAASVVALPGDAGRAQDEARRLAALLETAMREARATGRAIAWSVERDRYAFWQRGQDGDWTAYPTLSVYRPRGLPERIELVAVSIDGRELARGERVIFPPQGLRHRVSATLGGAHARFSIEGDIFGRVTLERIHTR